MTGILLVDKPEGWTSNDVVCKLRGVLHERRVGHSGTLDPMATGLLPVFVGKATKAVEYAENHSKRYIAGLRLGFITDTLDITGSVLEKRSPNVTDEQLLSVLPSYVGKISQIPPMYSALKINGQKMYQIARKGGTVERKPREIEIFNISLLEKKDDGDYILDVFCSKGTYIRSLCDDIGKSLGCGGCMSSLRRIQCGSFQIENAVPLEALIGMTSEQIQNEHLLPVDTLFSDYPEISVNEKEQERLYQGNSIRMNVAPGFYRVYSSNRDFLMLAEVKEGILRQTKSFYEV